MMKISPEEENLIKARKVIDDETLPKLRAYFIQRWNEQKDANEAEWSDSEKDGKALFPKVKRKNPNSANHIKQQIESGKTEKWDATCLFEAILALNIGKKASIFKKLREQRNIIFHRHHWKLSDTEKDDFFTAIRDAYTTLGWLLVEVNTIESETFTNEEVEKLKSQLESEKKKALKENQENLCKLRKKLKTFVGRRTEMKELKEKLSTGDIFIIITGGPCFGKSSFANELSHTLFEEKRYNYVIWINMRDISNPPQLEDVADKILKEFDIDTTEMKGEIVEILRRKFESITATGKRALLIFDNADALISAPIDYSGKSSTFTELSRHIRNYSRETIRAIFTTCVYSKSARSKDHHIVKLDHLSDEESKDYLKQELEEKKGLDKDHVMRGIIEACHGLPFALNLVCSSVNELRSIKMIKDYIRDLKKDPLRTVGEDDKQIHDIHLFVCFELSLKLLDESDTIFLSLLAVFPSRFSYTYVDKLISCVGKDDTINPRKLLPKLEKHSLIQDDSHEDEANPDESLCEQYYVIHSFFCQYIRQTYWKGSTTYQAPYYKLYINELFVLGMTSLKKDKYFDCWKEFEMEQHNFLYMMEAIGESYDQGDYPAHVKEAVREVLKRETPEFIAMCLFCIDLTKPSLLLKFVEVCEKLADDPLKKSIWCCRYDLNMKYFDREIHDPYKQLEPDKYGQSVLDKRHISKRIFASSPHNRAGSFRQILDKLEEFKNAVDGFESVTLKNYFNFHILKLKGCLLKKVLKVRELNVTKNDCIKMFNEALTICHEHFGRSWLTIDCYNQLGKLRWAVGDSDEAAQAFDKAIELAESMSLKNNKKFGSCLLDKGRFLIDLGIEEKVEEGRALLEDVIEFCNDFSDTKFWCRAMKSLLLIDKSKVVEVKHRFFQTEKLDDSLLDAMDKAMKVDADSPDDDFEEERFLEHEQGKVEDLLKAIKKLDYELKEMQTEKNSSDEHDGNGSTSLEEDAKKHLFVWQMTAALRYKDVLLLGERKKFAKNALKLMEDCSFIDCNKKDDLQELVQQSCDPKDEEMMRQMYFVDRICWQLKKEGKEDEVIDRYSTLLMNCKDNQELWSSIVLKRVRDAPSFYQKVTVFFSDQTKPCENLLTLVRYKFEYEIKVYCREADTSIIMHNSRRAVEDLKKAMEHLERLLLLKGTNAMEVVRLWEDSLRCWYKCMALETDHCLLDDKRCVYARKAMQSIIGLKKEEKEKLKSIISRESTHEEQESRRKKSLLCKVTKFMRKNGMQDDLEKRYEEFIFECASFPRLRFEMIKFILEKKNVEVSKFARYLSYLVRDFQSGRLTKGWDYQFVINIADQLFSRAVDRSSRIQNFGICRLIFDSLQFVQEIPGLKKKLEFEFLVIFALKVGNDSRDISLRKQDAQRALAIFSGINEKFKDEKLREYYGKLDTLLKS